MDALTRLMAYIAATIEKGMFYPRNGHVHLVASLMQITLVACWTYQRQKAATMDAGRMQRSRMDPELHQQSGCGTAHGEGAALHGQWIHFAQARRSDWRAARRYSQEGRETARRLASSILHSMHHTLHII